MLLDPFHLERYMGRHEFTARHLLASSDCETFPQAEVLSWADDECRELWQGLTLGYTETRGLPALRREIAGLYQGVSPDDVLEVVPEEGILLAMIALLEPGDHVIATHPGYQTLYGVAEQLGCEVTHWQPDEADGWRFDPAFVRAHLRPTTRLVVANFPHNPTGWVPTPQEYDELVAMVDDAGARLFSDEMYRWLERDGVPTLPSAVERSERAVTLCGMSKTFSLPGLRVGWLASRDEDALARIAALKDYTTICGSAPSEVLALIGLRERERLAAGNRQLVAANLTRLGDFIAARPGLFELQPPRGGSICFARLHAPEGAQAFCDALVEQKGVLLLPSTVFDHGDGHVRFGLGRAGFAAGLAAMGEWLGGAEAERPRRR